MENGTYEKTLHGFHYFLQKSKHLISFLMNFLKYPSRIFSSNNTSFDFFFRIFVYFPLSFPIVLGQGYLDNSYFLVLMETWGIMNHSSLVGFQVV